MRQGRELDVVLYGASGFTGRLIAHYLARNGVGSRVGLAGRSRDKLDAVREEVAAHAPAWDPPLLVCDAFDDEGLRALAARTRVVISAAGPYTACGTPLVAACVAASTDYVDINGETPWVADVIRRFDAEAIERGALIVPNCGYSIPSDLGAYFTATTLAERHGRPARRIRALMQFNGKLSGGTLSTGLLLDGASEAVRPPVASRLLPSRPRAPSPAQT